MQLLNREEFKKAAGTPLFHNRDFSLYDGAPYACVCGEKHYFSQFSSQHFASTGGSAKFMAQCPDNQNAATLIKTKNKFLQPLYLICIKLQPHLQFENRSIELITEKGVHHAH